MGRQYETSNDPSAAEVRAALERLVAGDIFRRSTQLAAFLRFVVETTLRGESDRIKGYTIATEVLGRGEDFDPEADPIVRVEAGRLRRALEQYYAGPGAEDKIVIDLPRGHYIPTFCRRVDQAVPAFYGIKRGSLAGILRPRVLLAAAAFALIGTTVVVAIGRWERSTEQATTASVPTDRQLISAFRAGNGFPIVSVQPFDTIGKAAVSRITPEGLRRKLTDALARFDEITVGPAAITLTGAGDHVSLPEHPSASKYYLGATAEYRDDGTVALTFRLVDTSDGVLVWSRTFDRTQFARDSGADEYGVVQEVAATLARTFGVIHSRERGKADNDPRYACVLKMLDYLHGLDAGNYAQARACLERVTKLDPYFAIGFAWLSWIYIREYQYEGFGHPADLPALDRALKAAQRAVSLKPQSARAHEALLGAYFARGEIATAFAAGDTALSLNPFDPAVRTVYGIRLIVAGQYDRGTALLKEDHSVQRPTWLDSYLFLAAYLKGDLATATRYANLDTSETYPLNLLARALSAAGNGDQDQARQMVERLDKLYPAFRDHARRELGKFIPSTEIVDRLTHDLAAAGLGARN
jgi:tetratricopeptide (TPR) repeat protein